MLITTQVAVETPESIDLYAEPAGIMARSLAFIIDFLIRGAIVAGCGIVFSLLGDGGSGVLLIVWFLVTWFYMVLFEVYRNGQTPGKKSLGLAVVNDDLTAVGWSTSITRNFLRFADALPLLYGAGIVTMILSPHFQRLGDLAAGTLVIYRRKESDKYSIPDCRPQPPPMSLERDDQLAFIGFAQRHQQLSEDRQKELANILTPLLPVEGEHRVNYVRGIGRWLLG